MLIPMEDWLRGCVYHDGRHGEVTLPTDKVLEIANYIQLTRTSQTDGCIELPPYTADTPLTDAEITEFAKGIVHKMIDNSDIAEDAYPDLRQRMHEAVDEYEPQTDCPWK